MSTSYDFKKEWEKTKKELIKFSKEAIKIAQKGEKELIEFSKKGKVHIDTTASALKKEQLYYLIGKEYIKTKSDEKPGGKLQSLVEEFQTITKEQDSLHVKTNVTVKKKRATKKKVRDVEKDNE